MKFSTSQLFLGAAALNLVSSAAVAQPDAKPTFEAVAARAEITELAKRQDNGAYCWRARDPYRSFFLILTWGEWDQDWGQGLRDSLRSECGLLLSDWSFEFKQGVPPTDGLARFSVSRNLYAEHCVEDAVWAASNAKGDAIWNMNCNDSDKWW